MTPLGDTCRRSEIARSRNFGPWGGDSPIAVSDEKQRWKPTAFKWFYHAIWPKSKPSPTHSGHLEPPQVTMAIIQVLATVGSSKNSSGKWCGRPVASIGHFSFLDRHPDSKVVRINSSLREIWFDIYIFLIFGVVCKQLHFLKKKCRNYQFKFASFYVQDQPGLKIEIRDHL